MKVVFIDDGVNNEFIQSDKICIRIIGTYTVLNNEVVPDGENYTEISHSSICAKIFIEEVNSSCDIYFIRILDKRTLRGSIYSLATALNWCLRHRIDVINLSLGTTNVKEAGLLQDSIEELVRNNVQIIAAASNNRYLTFPAAFKNVIGVKALNHENIQYPLDCFICEVPQKQYKYNEKYVNTEAYNSFAAPYITAKVCDCINNGKRDIGEIKNYLRQKNIVKQCKMPKHFKNIKPTILYELDKNEVHIEDVLIILDFFSVQGFYGICLTDSVPSNLSKGIINIKEVELAIDDPKIRLSYLTSYTDGDFFIWHMGKSAVGRTNLSGVDLIIRERITGEKLNRMLKEFTE